MNYQANTADEQLVQYFLNGDPAAMSTLVALYKDRVYNSIYTLMQDKYQSEEIFQAVFIKIIDNMMAGEIIEEGKFLPYALRIAHNLCLEHSRKLTQATVNNQNANESLQLNNFVPATFVSGKGTYESHTKIRNMIDMLPDAQREVIILNHYSGLNLKEIAEITKCSLNNALETMRFGLRNLRKLMIEKEFTV